MANKLLILGAAMAHKNKSYNLSGAISKGVDAGLKVLGAGLMAKKKRLDKVRASNDRITGKVTEYLDKLPKNPKLELLPEPIRNLYYNELNNAKSKLGELYIERGGANAANYAPGTDGYMEMTSDINNQRSHLDKLYADAKKFQEINANWFNEHGNISETWKQMNPELYEAMSNILNTKNPNYSVTLDENNDWVISTDIDNTDYSQITEDDDPSTQPQSSKNIKVKLDDLDWEQVAFKEIKYINDTMQASIDNGAQGVELTSPQINQMISGFEEMIGNEEGALYSLMFDKLPIGDMGGKMSIFTDEQFAEDYPNFDIDNPSTYPDFKEMKEKTINRLVEMMKSENSKAMNTVKVDREIDTAFEDFSYEVAAFKNGIAKLGNEATKKQIIDYIVNKSPYKGEINSSDGNMLLPKTSGLTQSVLQEFDIGSIVDSYIAGGYKNPDEIISTIIRETRSATDSKKTPRYLRQYNSLTQDQKNNYYSEGL